MMPPSAPAGGITATGLEVRPRYKSQQLPAFAPSEPAAGWPSVALFEAVAAYAEDVAASLGTDAKAVAHATHAEYVYRHRGLGAEFVLDRLRGVNRFEERWPSQPRTTSSTARRRRPQPPEEFPF